jgi:hypothetical protein
MSNEVTEVDGAMYQARDMAACPNKAEMAAMFLNASLRGYYSRERRERCTRFACRVIRSMPAEERARGMVLYDVCSRLAAGWSPAQLLAR